MKNKQCPNCKVIFEQVSLRKCPSCKNKLVEIDLAALKMIEEDKTPCHLPKKKRRRRT